jgi:hypothetical protein
MAGSTCCSYITENVVVIFVTVITVSPIAPTLGMRDLENILDVFACVYFVDLIHGEFI